MTGLRLGTLDLMGDGLFLLEALGNDEGTDWGNPAPIESQLNSFVQYGALVASQGWENRTAMVAVRARGHSAEALSAAEAALAAQLGIRNQLIYTPPGAEVSTAYDVLTSSFDQVPNDLLEANAGQRIFMVRLVCLPFGFSTSEVVTPALPAAPSSPTVVVVDSGDTASPWSGEWLDYAHRADQPGGSGATTNTASGGQVTLSSASPGGLTAFTLTRTGDIPVAATRYVVVDWQPAGGWAAGSLSAAAPDGRVLPKVSDAAAPAAGYTRSTFQVPASILTTLPALVLKAAVVPFVTPARCGIVIDQVIRTDTAGNTSGKQLLRTLSIGGTAPTTGSIAVEHETAALGETLLYTCAAKTPGYTPMMRAAYRATAPTEPTPDFTAVSGFYDYLGPVTFQVPHTALGDGEYLPIARLKSAAAIDVSLTAIATVGSIGVDSEKVSVSLPVLAAWTFVRFPMLHLPGTDLGSSGVHVFSLEKIPNVDDINVLLDELYLFNLTTGDLTQVSCGEGSSSAGPSSKRLWVDSPSIDNDGLGRMLRGNSADRSDAFSAYPFSQSPSIHEFAPGEVTTLAVTPGADAPAVSFRHRRAWAHTAAE